tara:strand:- start:3948 stop:4154 length:207 start_codon:yes stop_codon:yes gene_type:complete
MKEIKLDEDVIELLKAKLDKRMAEATMLLIKLENMQDRHAKVSKTINDICEVLESNCSKVEVPKEYES